MEFPRLDRSWQYLAIALTLAVTATCPAPSAHGQIVRILRPPEQRSIRVRDPEQMRQASIPITPRPPTVSHPTTGADNRWMSLDETIRTALEHARVIRILAGTTAVNSGQTIYDPAISNTTIDREQARFDPRVSVNNTFSKTDSPSAIFDPLDPNPLQPTTSVVRGLQVDSYNLNARVAKTVITGGDVSLNLNTGPSTFSPGPVPLNPQNNSSADITVTQPLLQGAGRAANLSPILVTRLNTERSFFQYKDSVQELVRGTTEAYWNVVFARTDVWARERQLQQAEEAFQLADAKARVGILSYADPAQTRVAMANFRATVITSRANLLQSEAVLRNILGFPPYDPDNLVPTTPPRTERLELDWEGALELAQVNRPDLIELKLIIEADEQLLIQANNQARPRLDGVAQYRWNGIEGEMPSGARLGSRPGQFADWTLGVNFSVPLGLRQGRANLRQQELLIARDRANLQQGLHATTHFMAANFRNLDQAYEQYLAYREAREAAKFNLQAQWARYRKDLVNFIVVLLAITDWGNAVSSEARAIVQYNIELANLERLSGTILESHGIRFYEERYGSISPLGRWRYVSYPESMPPSPNDDRYPVGSEASEQVFDLDDPLAVPRSDRRQLEELPPPLKE